MEIFYCESCGVRVAESEIDAGEALIKDLAVYCPKCVRADPELRRLLLETSRSSIPAAKKRLDTKGPRTSTATRLAPVKKRSSTMVVTFALVGCVSLALVLALMLGRRSGVSGRHGRARNVDPTRPLAPSFGGVEGVADRPEPAPVVPPGPQPGEAVGVSLLTSLRPGGAGMTPQVQAPPAPLPAPEPEKPSEKPSEQPPQEGGLPGPAPAVEAPKELAGQSLKESAWKDFLVALAREGQKGIANASAMLEAERERLKGLGLAEELERVELRLRGAERVEELAVESLRNSRSPVRLRCRDKPVSGKVVKVEGGKIFLRPVLGADVEVEISNILPEELARLAGLLTGESADPMRAASYYLVRGEPEAAISLLKGAVGRRAEMLREEALELAKLLAQGAETPASPAPPPVAGPVQPQEKPSGRTVEVGLPQPLIYLSFDEGTGTTTANLGSTSASSPKATFSGSPPVWTSNVPPNGGVAAVDFGTTIAPCGIDLPTPEELKGLVSVTVTGWVNCRNNFEGGGGNRIVSWSRIDGSADGIDLVYKSDGSLQVGINEHPDNKPSQSSPNKIPARPDADPSNWRFFAMTYDSTAPSGQVKFYFGTPSEPAALDKVINYNKGPLGDSVAPFVTVGNFVPAIRTTGNRHDRMFRGLIDEIRIYGSNKDSSGALTLEEIALVQRAKGGVLLDDLAQLVDSPEERKALLAECSKRPLTDGFLIDVGIVVSLAKRYSPEKVSPKKIASIGGSVVSNRAFDARLRKELGSAGYVFASNVGLAGTGMTASSLRKSVPRSLERERPEIVRICLDLSDVLKAKPQQLRADLAEIVDAVLERGAVPVIYTLPVPRELGDPKAEDQVLAFNRMVSELAIEKKIPYLDAWRILNELPGAGKELFSGNMPSQAGFDALTGRFLGLYRLVEKWVFGRRAVVPANR